MPILPKKTENRLPISTDVLINGIALTITRCTFQEYKMRYNINSDEFDDLDKGYECVYSPYHIIFIPDIVNVTHMYGVKDTMSNGNTLCQYELNTVQDGEEVLTNTKRAIKAINPDLDVDIYDETNNSVEAVIHNIMYDVIGYCAKNTR